MSRGLCRLFAVLFWLVAVGAGHSRAWGAPPVADPAAVARMRADVTALAALRSRMPGTPDYARAAALVQRRFREIGLQNVRVQTYKVTAPVTKKAQIVLNGQVLPLLPLYPNHVVPSSTPKEGITGPLIYAGQGRPADYNGQKIQGSIVVLDLNSGMNWFTAADLGAKAIIFLEPRGGTVLRGETESKFSDMPVEVPRYYARGAVAEAIRGRLPFPQQDALRSLVRGQGLKGAANLGQATVESQVLWERVDAQNIVGEIPGTDANLRGKPGSVLAVGGYFDSMSIAPDYAPGAEAAGNMAALLELARTFKAKPSRYTLQFVAEGAHHLALAGMRNWVAQNLANLDPDPDAEKDKANKARIATYKAFIGLDLTSHTPTVGLFAKSAFYNQMTTSSENILLNYYADFAKSVQTLADTEAKTRQAARDEFYVDGVRGQEGRTWRSYLPAPTALDAEVATRAAKPSLAFATANDARLLQDTPFDTPDRVVLPNLATQVSTVATLLRNAQQPGLDGTKTDAIAKLPEEKNFSNIFGYVAGRGLYRNLKQGTSFLPDTPLPDDQISSTPDGTQAVAYVLDQSSSRRRDNFKTYCGVRGAMIERATFSQPDPNPRAPQPRASQFLFLGPRVGDPKGGGSPASDIEAYSVSGSGRVIFAPDMGNERARFSPSFTTAKAAYDWRDKARGAFNPDASTICFECRSVALFDTVDQRYFTVLREMGVLDGGTNSEPTEYGYLAPSAPSGVATIDPVAVVFGRTGVPEVRNEKGEVIEAAKAGMKFKLIMAQGLLGKRLVLLDTTPQGDPPVGKVWPEGVGFEVPNDPETSAIIHVSYQTARDLWTLDQDRIQLLKGFGISNQRVDTLHGSAGCPVNPYKRGTYVCPEAHSTVANGGFIKAAEESLAEQRYDEFYLNSRQAFGLESRAYPDVEGTSQDVLKGIIFYLALLLPFSFFMERLLFGFSDIRKQIAGTSLCFLVVFVIISQVHPAFQLALTPMIILLAFIILALTVIVTMFLSSKFEAEIKRLKQGVHFADVGRLSALGAALGLGIANMRRRPTRTLLTCITLILLTFTVLSFTSVTANISNYARPYGDSEEPPSREGLMVRQPNWSGMSQPAVNSLRNEFGQEFGAVAPRSWLLARDQSESLALRVSSATDPAYYFTAPALCGWTPEEAAIGSPAPKTLVRGRWFAPTDPANVCLLPRAMFEAPQSTGTENTEAATARPSGPPLGRTLAQWEGTQVVIGGGVFDCIGVYDDAQWTGRTGATTPDGQVDDNGQRAIRDLDDEKMTPVDYASAASKQSNSQADLATQQGDAAQVQRYEHLDATALPLLPYDTVLAMGGQTRSVAASFRDARSGVRSLNGLMNRAAIGIFGATPNREGVLTARLYSSVESTSYEGFTALLVPILIAAMIIANTMLGSVFERTREIGIYSSIGLAPIHVAALFIAEAMVYSVLGSIAGYLIAQIVAKVITYYNLLPGITLNYSSSSAIIATLIVMATVLLSTLYPAIQAGRLSQPDRENKSDLGEPMGDVWRLQFPFTVSGQQSLGMAQFLVDFFNTHTDTSVGVFYTDKVYFSALSLREAVEILNTDGEGEPLFVAGADNKKTNGNGTNGHANGFLKRRGKGQNGGANGNATADAERTASSDGTASTIATPSGNVMLDTEAIAQMPAAPAVHKHATQQGPIQLERLAAPPEQLVYRLAMRVWLAPFDMGVSQDADIFMLPSEEPGLNQLQLKLVRRSGEIAAWKRVNRGFLGDLRKQLLLWRTIKRVDQQEYILRGRAHLQGQAVPVEEPGSVLTN